MTTYTYEYTALSYTTFAGFTTGIAADLNTQSALGFRQKDFLMNTTSPNAVVVVLERVVPPIPED